MVNMRREMLKLRKGDSAIMIKTDGSVELAGVSDKPLMDDKGMISPCILFAAAWAKKDNSLMNHLVDNFKNCVREGYFGPEAQSDFKAMEVEGEKHRLKQEQAAASGAVTAASGTVTQEEFDKHKEEQRRLKALADQGQDPQVLKQMETMKAGARSMTEKPFEGHKLPEEPEQTVGNVTIEEEIGNENK